MADNPIGTTIGDETFAAQDSESIAFMAGLPPNYKELPLPQQKALMADLAKLMARIAGKKVAAHALVWEAVTVDPTTGEGLDRPMPSVCQQFTTGGEHVAFWFKIGDGPTQWSGIGGSDWGEIDFDPSTDGYDKPVETIVWQVDGDGLPVAIWLKHGEGDTDWDMVWPQREWEEVNSDPSTGAGLDRKPKTIVWQVDGSSNPVAIWVKEGVGNTAWSKVWPIEAPAADISLPSPFALYQFWRGTGNGLKDNSGNQLNLSMGSGSETYAESVTSGQGFSFASGRYLRSTASQFRTLDDLSVVVAFQITSLPDTGKWGCIFTIDGETGSSGADNCLMVLGLSAAGKLSVAFEYDDGHVERLSPNNVLSTGVVYHVVVTRSGTTACIYLDGEQISQGTITHVESGSNAVLNVGKFALDPDSPFNGIINSMAFYNDELSGDMARHIRHDEYMRWGTRPSNGNTPADHAASHDSEGSDPLEVTEAMLSLSDNTTGDSGTGQHGFLKKLSGSTSEFMRGDGSWAVPYTSAFTTAYEVDFTALDAQNLLTGGNGNKTIDGKTWVLANSANLTTAYINDGTNNGLYLRCNTNNSSNSGTTLSSGAVYISLSGLHADLAKYQLHREIWVWVNFTMPHLPDANYEILQFGMQAGSSYAAANINRVSIMNYYSGGRGYGHTHNCLSGTDGTAEGGTGTAKDCFVIRIIDGVLVETYYGSMSSGNWPERSAITRSSRVVFGTTGRIARDNWFMSFCCGSGNTAGNADMLVVKMKAEYK